MAVLMEFFNVIIRNDTIEDKYPWWIEIYAKDVPNISFCTDNKITRVWFMNWDFLNDYIKNLENLWFLKKDNIDICITKMGVWSIWKCDWLVCSRLKWMWYDYTAYKWEIVYPNSIILPDNLDKNHISEWKLNYNFWYTWWYEVYFVDGEQKYHLNGDEKTPIKEYLEEYCRPLNYDKKTYELIIWPYSKDKNNVYFLRKIIKWADPKSFKLLSLLQLVSKDDNNIFYVNIKMHNIDINTFELKWWYFAVDSNYIYNYYLNEIECLNNKPFKFWSFNMDNAYYYYDDDKNLHIKTYKGEKYIFFSWKEDKYEYKLQEWIYYYPNKNIFLRNKT